jgi:hypothetical protein
VRKRDRFGVEEIMSILEQLRLIEAELIIIRRMAEHVNNDYLLYIIDMAIAEVDSKSLCGNDNNTNFLVPTGTTSLRNNH